MRIVAQDLTYTYNAKSPFASQALCGVTLTIEEGEFFGIIGHTGSGKSTFVQHLNALIRLTGGSLKVGEYDLADKKCNFLELRSKVGMVFQYPEYQLFAETVEKDVMFGLKNFAKDMKEEEMKAAVREALEIVDLNYAEIKDKSPFELSGGQKRRVAIAGIMAMRPQVLFLDEPTAVLTPQETKKLFAVLRKMKEDGKSIIIITHKLHEVLDLSDKVSVLRKGEYIGTVITKDTNEAELTEMMVGKKVSLDIDRTEPENPTDRLIVSGLNCKNRDGVQILDDVTFTADRKSVV